jgi:transposase
MKKRSIYPRQSQEVQMIYEAAGTARKVLIGAIDYAKKNHLVMLCNGDGDILRKPFTVHNTPEGIEYLGVQVQQSCRYHRIRPEHVFFGGEDGGSFSENFAACLRERGWLVAGINAYDAKRQRENLQASTDRLDLIGIARSLAARRGNFHPCQSGAYLNLRNLMRHRRLQVRLASEERNRMHVLVDRLFPGYLEEKRSGLTPFAKPSLKLMEQRFSARQIAKRKLGTLARLLAEAGATCPEQKAAQLQGYARRVLPAESQYISTWQLSLAQHVSSYECLRKSVEVLEREMAMWLAQTQGAFLLSVHGIGMVLASGVAAEIGDPWAQQPLSNLSSYAGIVPRVKQSGGCDSEASVGSVAKRCNRILKDYTVQSAVHMGLHGVEELKGDYHRRDAAGQHAQYGIARRYLRMGMHLMRNSSVYLPRELRRADTPMEARREYYQHLWPYLLEKFRAYQAHQIAFDPAYPLGQWREMIQEYYGIKLKISS